MNCSPVVRAGSRTPRLTTPMTSTQASYGRPLAFSLASSASYRVSASRTTSERDIRRRFAKAFRARSVLGLRRTVRGNAVASVIQISITHRVVGSQTGQILALMTFSPKLVLRCYRDADAAIEYFSVTGEVLGTPNAKMKQQLGKGRPEAVHDVDGVAGSGIGAED